MVNGVLVGAVRSAWAERHEPVADARAHRRAKGAPGGARRATIMRTLHRRDVAALSAVIGVRRRRCMGRNYLTKARGRRILRVVKTLSVIANARGGTALRRGPAPAVPTWGWQ